MAEVIFKLLRCDAEASHLLGWAKNEVRRLMTYAGLDVFSRKWVFGDVTVTARVFEGVARLWLEAESTESMAVWATLPSPTNFTTLFAQNAPAYVPPPEPPIPGPPGPSTYTYSVFFQFFGLLPSGGWEGITHGPNWWDRDGMSGTTTAEGTWSVVSGQPHFTPNGVYRTSIVGSLTAAMVAPYVRVSLATDTGVTVIENVGVGNWTATGTHDGSVAGMRSALTAGLTTLVYPPPPPTYSRRAVITSAQEVLHEGWVQETGLTYPAPYWDGRDEVLFYTNINPNGGWRGASVTWGPSPVGVTVPDGCLPMVDNPPPLPPVITAPVFSVGEYVANAELNTGIPSNIGVYTVAGAPVQTIVSMQRVSDAASYVRIRVGGQSIQIDGQCSVTETDVGGGVFIHERNYTRYVVDARRVVSGILQMKGTKQSGVFVASEVLVDQRTYEWIFLTEEYRNQLFIVYDNEKRMQEDMWLEPVYSARTRGPYKAASDEFVAAVQARNFVVTQEWETLIKSLAPIARVKRDGGVVVDLSEALVTNTPERVERQRTITLTTTYPQAGETPAFEESETLVGTLVMERVEHVKEAGYEWEATPVSYSYKHTYDKWFVPYGWASDGPPPEVVGKHDAARAVYDLMPDVVEPINRPAREAGMMWSGEVVQAIDSPAVGVYQNNFPVYDYYVRYAPPKPLYTNTLRGEVPDILRRYYRSVPQKNLGDGSEPTALERYWLSSSLVPGSTCTCVFIAPVVSGVSMGCFASRNDFQTTAEFEVIGAVTLVFSWDTGRFSVGDWRPVGRRFVSHRAPGNALIIYRGIKWDDVKEKARAQRKALGDPNDPAHDPLMKAVLDALTLAE